MSQPADDEAINMEDRLRERMELSMLDLTRASPPIDFILVTMYRWHLPDSTKSNVAGELQLFRWFRAPISYVCEDGRGRRQ
jgi:hypothetical protein